VAIAQLLLAPAIGRFMSANPGVRLELDATNRRVDVIGEGYDVALRVRESIDDSSLIVRTFGESPLMLVASPGLLDSIGRPRTPEALAGVPGIGQKPHDGRHVWQLFCADGQATQVPYDPRLVTDDFMVLLQAAIEGVGVAMLPTMYCREPLDSGALELLLPQWGTPIGTLHAVFPSRKGMPPAVRRFVDFLAEILPESASRVGMALHVPPGMHQPVKSIDA
jgi:DNA-binding transcriptional LysR family regulator